MALDPVPSSDDNYADLIHALGQPDQDSSDQIVEAVPGTPEEIPGFEIGGSVDLALNQFKSTVKNQFEQFRNGVIQECEERVAIATSQQQTELQNAMLKMQQLKELAAKLQLCYDRSESRDQHRVLVMIMLSNKWYAIKTISGKFHRWLLVRQKLKLLRSLEVNYAVPKHRRDIKRRSLHCWRRSLIRIQKARREEWFKSQLDLVSRKLVTTYEANLQAMRTELVEAKRQIAVLVQNKEKVEREMKQAFFRSVSALNLEAMSMFSVRTGEADADPAQGEDIEPRLEIPKPISNNEDSRDP